MRLTKGRMDRDYWFAATDDVEPEAKRSVWDLLRAQEHVTILFVTDEKVPFDEAWCVDMTVVLPRWRVNPLIFEHVEAPDWRPTYLIPEDFYAA